MNPSSKKTIIGVIVGGAIAALAGSAYLYREEPAPLPIAKPGQTRRLNRVSTSTELIEPFFLYVYDSQKEQTGSCFAIRDASGIGFTYLTAEDGVLKVNAAGCAE